MRLSEYASTRKTRGSYKMPRSVQQSIPIDRIYADGVWQSENVFSMMWQISDINYAMQSDAAKQNILTQLGTVYAGIPADCWMQVCIVSQRMDEKAFARDVLYHRENDGFDALRAERNRQIKANARENGNVVQHKYIIVSTNKPGVKEARERFVQVQGHLLSAFSALECAVTPLDNRARLEVLHKFFRISEEGRFNFDFDNCAKLGQDFRDSIAPDCIRFCKKHIEIEDFYAKCMTISEYPQQLDDKFISALLQQVPYIVLSIDIEPVETDDAFKEIDNAQMKTDAEKVRFNKKSVENLDFTSSVPQRTQEQDRIIASIRKEMTENDQQMFLSLLTVTYFADTLEDLALETDALKTTAANYNCRFTELYFQQERAFNTAMPYGLRRIESVRTMLTKSLTALVPFNTQEILTPGGICYGRNAVTGNLIIGLRTTLVNGNAMVVATSGGGKSMFVKLEILMLYLRFTKARFYVVDPENEYAPLVQELGGEVVNISVDSATHFNPLDFKYDKATPTPPASRKMCRTALPMTPPMPCWQTPNLWSCCAKPRTLTAWWSCTDCPSRSGNICCWPNPVRVSSRWATALSHSTTPNPRTLRHTSCLPQNPVKWSENMSENEIRVLYVQPGKYPEERTIPNTYEARQKLVGEDLTVCHPWRDNACIISNDAAQDLDLPPNRLYGYDGCIAGSFIVCGDSDDGLISLTDEQMAYYEKLYHHPIAFLPMVHSFLPMKCTPEQYEQFQRDGNKLKPYSPKPCGTPRNRCWPCWARAAWCCCWRWS